MFDVTKNMSCFRKFRLHKSYKRGMLHTKMKQTDGSETEYTLSPVKYYKKDVANMFFPTLSSDNK